MNKSLIPFRKKKKKTGGRRGTKKNGFRSIFEDTLHKNILSSIKEEIGYESEKLDYIVEHTYTPDFIIENKNTGRKIYVEAKGYFDATDRKKILAVLKCNPEVEIRMIFQNGKNTISKNSKITYLEWCEKNEILATEDMHAISKWHKEINT